MGVQVDDTLTMLDAMPHVILWYTDADGRIVHSVGGALRPIGLIRDATAGTHVSEWGETAVRRWQDAMRGYSGIAREYGDWKPAQRRRYITAWAPYYADRVVAGMLVVAFDITELDVETVEEIHETLAQALPVLSGLARKEAERLALEVAEAERLQRTRRSWLTLGTWTTQQVLTRLSVPITIIGTALALWVASRLGVLAAVLDLVGL